MAAKDILEEFSKFWSSDAGCITEDLFEHIHPKKGDAVEEKESLVELVASEERILMKSKFRLKLCPVLWLYLRSFRE